MTKRRTDEELMEGREIRRAKYEDRFMAKLDRQMAKAEALVGHLIREGKKVFYVNVQSKTGNLTGAIKEFASEASAIDYLIRNRYV